MDMLYYKIVQTSFYASGFLYSLKTHQILLLQPKQKDDAPILWSTLGGESKIGEEAVVSFKRIISKLLNINLKVKNIYQYIEMLLLLKNNQLNLRFLKPESKLLIY